MTTVSNASPGLMSRLLDLASAVRTAVAGNSPTESPAPHGDGYDGVQTAGMPVDCRRIPNPTREMLVNCYSTGVKT